MGSGGIRVTWVVAAHTALLLGGCSLSAEAPDASAGDTPSQASGTSSGVQCLDAGNLARGILADSRDGAELTVVDARAVRSPGVEDVYLVAIRFGGHPTEDTGVWASSTLELGDESVRSVDVAAVQVSQWPWSLVTEPKIVSADPGVAAARSCL